MKLYHGRGSCSLGILILIEELDLPHEAELVDLAAGAQRSPEFLAVNPKGKVPFLQLDDGSTLSEWPAIALYLALSNPKGALLPVDPVAVARVFEAVEYMVSTAHMQGFTRIVRPGNFSPDESAHDRVKARGHEILGEALEAMAGKLGDKTYLFGEFSVADAALFYLENWMVRRLERPLPAACQRHFDAMSERPAVQRALAV
jgi:glutathione S-transferase